jgi:hypothetical protein
MALSAAVLVAWFPAGSLLHQRSSLASASAALHQLHQQDTALAQERANLSSSAEISRLAREQYQLVDPGQQAYQVLPPSGMAAGAGQNPGDPGTQSPVAPSASAELPPGDLTTTTVAAGSDSHAHSSTPSAFSRMVRALEFWR